MKNYNLKKYKTVECVRCKVKSTTRRCGSAFTLTKKTQVRLVLQTFFSEGMPCRISQNRNAARLRFFFLQALRPRKRLGILIGVTPQSTANSNDTVLRKIRITGNVPITVSIVDNAKNSKSANFHRQAAWGNAVVVESSHTPKPL